MRQHRSPFQTRCPRFALAILVLACGILANAYAAESVNDVIKASDGIVTYLLDTGTPSPAPLTGQVVAEKSGWLILKEDDVTHAFQGDAVLLNNKLAVVIRKSGAGAEVYTLSAPGGPVLRGTLAALPASSGAALSLKPSRIVENGPGAVALRAESSPAAGKPIGITYRLTTGQSTVQMDPGEGVDVVRVSAQTDYIIAPDFFADDLVFDAHSTKAPWAGLPAENFFLHLSGGGNTIITCVWQTNGRNTRALFSGEGDKRVIDGSEIECAAGKLVWTAFSEFPTSWHATTLSNAKSTDDVALWWKPPFPAKWRGNFVTASEVAQSWNFLDKRTPDYASPASGKILYPCWFQNGGPYVHLPQTAAASAAGVPLVVYPIDRSQDTPLDMFVLVDVMRSTLGVGPCQYILDVEGLDAQSSPTPALVMEWIEKQYKKKRADKDAAAIREKLTAMVAHIDHSERRIAQYVSSAAALETQLKAGTPDADDTMAILRDLEASAKQLAPARKTPERAAELAESVVKCAGKENWEEQFLPIRDELCAMGSAQDCTLSKCRMALRRVKQRCVARAATDPAVNALLKQIDDALKEGK